MMFLGIHDVQLLLIACIPQIPHSLGIIVSHSKDPIRILQEPVHPNVTDGFCCHFSIKCIVFGLFPPCFCWLANKGSSRFKVLADSWCHFGWLGQTSWACRRTGRWHHGQQLSWCFPFCFANEDVELFFYLQEGNVKKAMCFLWMLFVRSSRKTGEHWWWLARTCCSTGIRFRML